MGLKRSPETSVTKHQPTLRNIPKQSGSQLESGRSLKSTLVCISLNASSDAGKTRWDSATRRKFSNDVNDYRVIRTNTVSSRIDQLI